MLTEIITPPLSFPFKTQLHTPSIEQYLNYFQFFLPDFQNQFPKKGKNLIQCLSIYWVLFLSPFWMWTGRKYLPSHYQRTEWQKYSTLSLWVWKGSRYSQSFPLSVLWYHLDWHTSIIEFCTPVECLTGLALLQRLWLLLWPLQDLETLRITSRRPHP